MIPATKESIKEHGQKLLGPYYTEGRLLVLIAVAATKGVGRHMRNRHTHLVQICEPLVGARVQDFEAPASPGNPKGLPLLVVIPKEPVPPRGRMTNETPRTWTMFYHGDGLYIGQLDSGVLGAAHIALDPVKPPTLPPAEKPYPVRNQYNRPESVHEFLRNAACPKEAYGAAV